MKELNKISVYINYFSNKVALYISVLDFCLNIINSDYAEEIIRLRREQDKKHRDEIKATLPAVAFGIFEPTRAKENLIKHSGYICIDIDQKGNPKIKDWAALRNSLSDIENIYFIALSASGKGVFLIIPISNPDQHENHFRALEIDFQNMGIVIDKACKDVSRLRGVSYDPEAIINTEAKTYRRIYQPPKPKQYTHSTHSPEIKKLAEWAATKAPFVNGSRHEFIKQLAGACHRFGISESETRGELLHYQQTDFSEKEIENIIKWTYANAQYFGVSVHKGR